MAEGMVSASCRLSGGSRRYRPSNPGLGGGVLTGLAVRPRESSSGLRGGVLTGLAAVQSVFHFLGEPADVLFASAACRRWRELACADSVWRARFERENLVEKARLFEVALPASPSRGVAAAAALQGEAAGVGLAFYARVFLLKVVAVGASASRSFVPTAFPRMPPPSLTFAIVSTVQGYPMRDEASSGGCPDPDGGIHTAVHAWCEAPVAAKAKYGPIASWDTSRVTDMSRLFHDRHGFNEDISRWDVSNVVHFFCTFNRAASFDGDLSRWLVGRAETMNSMFYGATSFDGDLSRWDVGSVKSMVAMFATATRFHGDLSGWEVGSVKSMNGLFRDATSFNGDLSRWDVGQVECMYRTFYGATSFTCQLGGAWTTSVADQRDMFGAGCPGSVV
jgi:hypothetical protein